MLASSRINGLLVILGAGLCLALPFIFTFLWWLIIPGLALTIHCIISSESYRDAILIGWFLGVAKSLGGFYFVWSTFPLTGVILDNLVMEWLCIFLYWASDAIFMGMGGIVLGIGLYWLSKRKPIFALLAFPFLLIVAEVVGSLFVSIVFLGPGAFLNIYLANGYSGISLAHLPILYPFVRLAGVYGLAFVAAIFGALLYRLFSGNYLAKRNTVAILLAVMVSIYILYLFFSPMPYVKTGDRYISVETEFPTRIVMNKENLPINKDEELVAAVVAAYQHKPDVILLAEDARLINAFGSDEKTLGFLQSISKDIKPLVVDSARTEIENNSYSYLRAFYYDTENGQIYNRDKQYLVSGGEYISYLFRVVLSLLGQQELVEATSRDFNYVPGPMKNYDNFPKDFPAITFCFESSSAFAAKRNNPLSNVVLHPLSHSNFHTPELLWYQMDALLRTQAIWSGKVIISATNMAQSKIYYPDGRIETGEVVNNTPFWHLVIYNI